MQRRPKCPVRNCVETKEGQKINKDYALKLLYEQADVLEKNGPKGNKYKLAAQYFATQVTGEDYSEFLTS